MECNFTLKELDIPSRASQSILEGNYEWRGGKVLRHPRGKKWEPVYEPPERIQQCLHCKKTECTNCFHYAKRSETQRRILAKLRERREAEKEKEWNKIEKMLDAGISARRITRILGKNESYFYSGKHTANYKAYRAKKERRQKQHGNTDRKTETD